MQEQPGIVSPPTHSSLLAPSPMGTILDGSGSSGGGTPVESYGSQQASVLPSEQVMLDQPRSSYSFVAERQIGNVAQMLLCVHLVSKVQKSR